MPLSFGSLLGGLATLVGTSPNIIVSRMRQDIVGEPFSMFDFAPVGIGLAVVGVVFLTLRLAAAAARRKGRRRRGCASSRSRTTRPRRACRRNRRWSARRCSTLKAWPRREVTVVGIIRERVRRYVPSGHWTLFADDILVLEGEAQALEKITTDGKLNWSV